MRSKMSFYDFEVNEDRSLLPGGSNARLTKVYSTVDGDNNQSALKNSAEHNETKRKVSFNKKGELQSPFSAPSSEPISLVWEKVSFEVKENKWSCFRRKAPKRAILSPQSGLVVSGTLTGILGPSGAGKTTLLSCLTGRYKEGVSGDVFVAYPNIRPEEKVRVSFVPQKTSLFGILTVRETFMFASRITNHGPHVNHGKEVDKVIASLNLGCCDDVRISDCSGGQEKRVSVGVELISKPNILVIDEPTTGLDSSIAYQCVQLLRDLVDANESPPAILASIHQPSVKILHEFHFIYLLSNTGRCLYFGPTADLRDHFWKAALEFPMGYNPADFAIEIAVGDHQGEDCFDKLEQMTRDRRVSPTPDKEGGDQAMDRWVSIGSVVKDSEAQKLHVLGQIWLLLSRNCLQVGRGSNRLWLRLILSLTIGLLMAFLWSPGIGQEDGCWDGFRVTNASNAKQTYSDKISNINSNIALVFIVLVYVMLISMITTVLSFPNEVSVVVKEMRNNWYNCWTYFWAKTVSEVPVLLMTTFVILAIIYPLTGQIKIAWRFAAVYAFVSLMGEVSQSLGMIYGTLYAEDTASAAFTTIVCAFPPILFGGFVVKFSQIRWFLQPLAYMSFFRFAFEGVLLSIYGFNRCEPNGATFKTNFKNPLEAISFLLTSINTEKPQVSMLARLVGVNESCVNGVIGGLGKIMGTNHSDSSAMDEDPEASFVLGFYGLKDSVFALNLIALLAFIVVFKFATYFLLLRKTRL